MLGESFYKIPRFQRPYSWDRTNVEEFWEDAIVGNEAQYFIGNFVVYEDKATMGVVDGQQRLTTITLLLCALRDAFEAEGFHDLAEGIHGLIERKNISNELLYVLQTESSYPYLQEHIQKFKEDADTSSEAGPEELLLKQAFEFFEQSIATMIKSTKAMPNLSPKEKKEQIKQGLSEVRNKVLNLNLIYTSLDNDEDAYVIFETLNTRGKDLTLSDLVKSHLSRLLKPSNKGVDVAKDKWEKINEIFEESPADLSISTFIHHHWLSRYQYITEKKLYKELRKNIKKENAKAFLNDLVKESEIYRYIHEPSSRKWKNEETDIRNALIAMNIFRIKQQLPIVLSVLRQYEDGTLKTKQVRSILRAIENFHFGFTAIASQRSSGGISFMYALAARDLYKAAGVEAKSTVLNDFKKDKLAARRPGYAEFEAGFAELRFSSKMSKQRALVKYVLTKLYQANSTGLPIDHQKATMEHLAPQSPNGGPKLADDVVASIGNLILVDQTLNNKLANKTFAEKVKLLKDAKVWVDPVILKAKEWGAPEIEKRTKLLAKEAYDKVWAL